MASEKQKGVKADLKAYLAEIGAKGGKTAAEKLTKEQRIERAKKAVSAREAKKGR